MKHEIAEQWVEALRSGEYRQTKERLRDRDDGFCCLGVLCDLYDRSHGGTGWGEPAVNDTEICFLGHDVDLPVQVAEWAGLKTFVGYYDEASKLACIGTNNLAATNDSGASFSDIANIIEYHIDDL